MEPPELSESVDPSPQPQPEPRVTSHSPLRPGLWVMLGVALAGAGGVLWRSLSPPVSSQPTGGGPPRVASVKLQRLRPSVIEEGTSFVGNLEARQGIELRPKVGGRITKIFVTSGAPVQSGQAVLQLSSGKNQAEFRASLATVSSARADRNNAQAQLRVAQAQRSQATAEVSLQNTEYKRIKSLVSQGVLARRELDRVTRDRQSARAALNVATEQIQAAQANIVSAQADLAENVANTNAVRAELQDTQVTAPIAGVIGNLAVKVGDFVNAGDSLTTITQNQTLEVELAIPLERRQDLERGLPVKVKSFQSNETLATGNISFISPTVNAATQSVLAKASFNNGEGKLQDGQRVAGTVIWQKRTGALVPTQAISRLGGKTFVFVAEPAQDNAQKLVASQRPVTLGGIQGNDYQVISGVQPGETIVVSGILNLADGAAIQAQ